jgi:[ribosomal protein S18]-alanine N-acetyltransferase
MRWAIRRMANGDVDAVLTLGEKTPETPHWRREEYERILAADESIPLRRSGFVAEAAGHLLGFSVGKVVAGICELESIAVTRQAQGQGIGRELLQALAHWAQANGTTRMELEVRASNTRAIKLYEQAGMRREGLRTAYYQSPTEDAVLMGASLLAGGKLS